MIPAPGALVVITLSCPCGAVIQRVADCRKPGDNLCYSCSPDTLEERTRMLAKAGAEAARPKADFPERQQ